MLLHVTKREMKLKTKIKQGRGQGQEGVKEEGKWLISPDDLSPLNRLLCNEDAKESETKRVITKLKLNYSYRNNVAGPCSQIWNKVMGKFNRANCISVKREHAVT